MHARMYCNAQIEGTQEHARQSPRPCATSHQECTARMTDRPPRYVNSRGQHGRTRMTPLPGGRTCRTAGGATAIAGNWPTDELCHSGHTRPPIRTIACDCPCDVPCRLSTPETAPSRDRRDLVTTEDAPCLIERDTIQFYCLFQVSSTIGECRSRRPARRPPQGMRQPGRHVLPGARPLRQREELQELPRSPGGLALTPRLRGAMTAPLRWPARSRRMGRPRRRRRRCAAMGERGGRAIYTGRAGAYAAQNRVHLPRSRDLPWQSPPVT